MGVPATGYPIDVFTAHYRVSGAIEMRGNVQLFLNNDLMQTLIVQDATAIPLRPGVELEPMFSSVIYVPKGDAEALVLGNVSVEDVKPLPKRELLVCLTDLFIMKGYVHVGMDTRLEDAFSIHPQPFLFVTNLQIASLYAEATGVRANALSAFIHRKAVRAYFRPEQEQGAASA